MVRPDQELVVVNAGAGISIYWRDIGKNRWYYM